MQSKGRGKLVNPEDITPELRERITAVKNRILFLSPSVTSGEEAECRKEDFESLANSNIGVGGFGKVYKVRHKRSQNVYAVKVINKSKILENDLAAQVKLELRIMYQLNHEYVIKLYNHFEDNDNFYLILQLAEGGQLYSKLKKEGYFSERISAQFMRELICAVEYLHSLDPPVIHRDIKPQNILIDKEGRVKLADFGWSNFFEEERVTYCGTPEYLAPEMINKAGHDHSIDLWNLGILLYELLIGSPPFEAKSQKQLFGQILNGKIKFPKARPISIEAQDLICKLLRQNPKERITLSEMKRHPWFKKNKLVREMVDVPTGSRKLLVDEPIERENYEVISKESLINKENVTGNQAVQSYKDKVKKLTAASSSTDPRPPAVQSQKKHIAEIKLADLEVKYDAKVKELDALSRKYSGLKVKLEEGGSGEELLRLKKVDQDRETVLKEVEVRNQQLRDTEAKLRAVQLELEGAEGERRLAERQVKDLQLRVGSLENENKALLEKVEMERENRYKVERESQSKIDKLEYEMLRKGSSESSFEKLLSLCQVDLQHFIGKFENQRKNSENEEALRNRLLESQKEAYESKVKIEEERLRLTREHTAEVADLTSRFEREKREIEKGAARKIEELRERVRELELIEFKEKHESTKFASIERQLQLLSDDNMQLKSKMAGLDKASEVNEDYVRKLNEKIRVLSDEVDIKNQEISKLRAR